MDGGYYSGEELMEAIADCDALWLIGGVKRYDEEHGTHYADGLNFYRLSRLIEDCWMPEQLYRRIVDGLPLPMRWGDLNDGEKAQYGPVWIDLLRKREREEVRPPRLEDYYLLLDKDGNFFWVSRREVENL